MDATFGVSNSFLDKHTLIITSESRASIGIEIQGNAKNSKQSNSKVEDEPVCEVCGLLGVGAAQAPGSATGPDTDLG